MAAIEKRSRDGKTRWLARWRDDAGKQRSRSFAKKSDAEKYLAGITVSLASGDYIDPRAGKVTFSQYYEDFATRQVWRPGTVKAMNLACRHVAFADVQLGRVRRSHVQSWVKSMTEDLAPGTVKTRFNNVRLVFRSAVTDRLIRYDPTDGVSLPKRDRPEATRHYLGPKEAAALLEAAKPEFLAFVALGLFAGLRLGEVAGIQVRDIDFLKRRLSVRRQVQRVPGGVAVVPPKSESSVRTIAIPGALVEILSEHIRLLPTKEPNRFLFLTSGGVPTDQNVAGTAFRRTRVRAGLPTVTFHDLRHTYASALIAGGADVVKVQHALGHASANTTLSTYSHLWPDSEDVTRGIAAAFADEVLNLVCNRGVTPTPGMPSDLRR